MKRSFLPILALLILLTFTACAPVEPPSGPPETLGTTEVQSIPTQSSASEAFLTATSESTAQTSALTSHSLTLPTQSHNTVPPETSGSTLPSVPTATFETSGTPQITGEIPVSPPSGQPGDLPDEPEGHFTVLNGNFPSFTVSQLTTKAFEYYSELDWLGRCGTAFACIGPELMPTEERGSIGQVKPTGWHTVKYDVVDGKYLYNRCHLIGYQLTGENANVCNLITGTRSMNVDGMLPFENMVADYVTETQNHVMYRVTPVFEGDELLSRGVIMEAFSVEDEGEGICFNVFVFNAQSGIVIDYATGQSRLEDPAATEATTSAPPQTAVVTAPPETLETSTETSVTEGSTEPPAVETATYILNTNSKKIHYPTCGSVANMKEENKKTVCSTVDELIAQGYTPCGNCKPN